MSKPFMCGDEVAVYVPGGGCDCNYTLQRVESEQYAFAYKLMLNGSQVGDLITVPFDKYVNACELKYVEVAEIPYAGAKPGDAYLDITFANMSDHIYVSLASLMGGGYLIVDSLPEVGDPRYIYMVDDGQGGYNRYVWDAENEDWIDLGSTEIDLSNYYTKTEVDNMISGVMLRFYPIGSIYTSISDTDPGTIFGGTWDRLTDTFLYAVPSGQADTGSTTKTAGSADAIAVAHSHSVNAVNTGGMSANASHAHTYYAIDDSCAKGTYYARIHSSSGYNRTYTTSSTSVAHVHTVPAHNTNSAGSSGTGANMPPYMRVYMWKRTA